MLSFIVCLFDSLLTNFPLFPRLFLYSQGVAKDELERRTLEKFNALKIDYTTCPGQSENHYGSQANNKHFVEVEGFLLCSPTLGIWYNTNALKADPAGAIKDAVARESGLYHGITINVDGKERIMKEIYMTKYESQPDSPLTTYKLKLQKSEAARARAEEEGVTKMPPKKQFLARANADASGTGSVTQKMTSAQVTVDSSGDEDDVAVMENGKRVVTIKLKLASEVLDQTLEAILSRGNAEVEASNAADSDADDEPSVQGEEGTQKRKHNQYTVSQHQANNQISFNSGFDSKDKEGDAFLEKNCMSCYEQMYLVTGDSQVDQG